MEDRTRAHREAGPGPSPSQEAPLARELTTCVLDFIRDQVTPVAEWVSWSGGDPELVLLLVAETLHSIAEGLAGEPMTQI
jgi:hypothetical protein